MSFFGARYPIVQAPMAYVGPPSLAAAASAAGALGTIAAAALSADETREAIREVRSATDAPFGVNVFAPPYLRYDVADVVLEERPAVFSFTFGIVDPEPFQDAGIAVLGTATTAEEASALDAAGVDAVVAQGAEAGGHRGTFLGSFEDGLVPLDELVASISVSVPVIAAGGIVSADDVRRVCSLGASGVQVGTAFLFTHESAVTREHLDALRRYDTVVTPAYTGRHMRAARTPVLEELMQSEPVAYPEQRAVSAKRGPLFMGGTNARAAREQSVAELVGELARGF
ncbi:MAG TPA: nitronate monooxygenase [Gaiellaceae bacterium]|nr:nitronate monooxygenase [Gaiellaceae bacterium]